MKEARATTRSQTKNHRIKQGKKKWQAKSRDNKSGKQNEREEAKGKN
jgi:hypothetical protein